MTTSNQLLPCPFCGGSSVYQRLRDGSKYGAYECGECGAQGPDVRTGYGPEEEWRDKATAAWNERSADAPPAAAHGDDTRRIDWLACKWRLGGTLPDVDHGSFREAIDAAMRAQGDDRLLFTDAIMPGGLTET
jgi:Lar family restriction alleviation protein